VTINSLTVSVLLTAICFVILAEVTKLPDSSDKPVSHAIKNGADTRMGKAIAPLLEKHPRRSAVHTGYIRHRRDLLNGGVELFELDEQLKSVEGEL
jgi:hypothetical protein